MRSKDSVIVYLTHGNYARSAVVVFVIHSWRGKLREFKVCTAIIRPGQQVEVSNSINSYFLWARRKLVNRKCFEIRRELNPEILEK